MKTKWSHPISRAVKINRLAQVRPDEASHRQPEFRDGGYPNEVLPLGGDQERRRREGAGVFLGSYRVKRELRQKETVKL